MSVADIAVAITPIVTGSLSLIASSTIISKIMGSEVKLQSPYSRLIFGLSLYDVISSSCNIASTMAFPVGTPDVWGAIGSDLTCSIQGVLFSFSTVVTPFYNCALCIYYLCVIKYYMQDAVFSKRVEPFIHGTGIIFSVAVSIYLLSKNIIHTTDTMCWITAESGDIEDVRRLRWMISGIPLIVILAAIIVIMAMITWSVWMEEKKMDNYVFGQSDARFRGSQARNRTKVKAVQRQANYYFLGFAFTYGPAFAYRVLEGAMEEVPLFFVLLSRFTHPLQGIFNLIAHMQPQVTALRHARPDLGWIRAFFESIKHYDSNLDRVTIASRARSLERRESSAPENGTFMERLRYDLGSEQDHTTAKSDVEYRTDAAIALESDLPSRQTELKNIEEKDEEETLSPLHIQVSKSGRDEKSNDSDSPICRFLEIINN